MSNLPVKLEYVLKQVKVTADYEFEVVEALSTYFAKMADWEGRINALVINGPDDQENMNKAAEGRKLIQSTRLAALEVIKKARTRIQASMADQKNADTLWLRASQTVEADCKALEAKLKEKEETRIRYELEQKEKLKAERLAKITPICPNPHIYPLGDMDEGDFNNLFSVLELQHRQVLEAERQMEEVIAAQEKLEAEAREREVQALALAKKKQDRMRRLYTLGVPLDDIDGAVCFVVTTLAHGSLSIAEDALDLFDDEAFEAHLVNFQTLLYYQAEETKAAQEAAAAVKAQEIREYQIDTLGKLGFTHKDKAFVLRDMVLQEDETIGMAPEVFAVLVDRIQLWDTDYWANANARPVPEISKDAPEPVKTTEDKKVPVKQAITEWVANFSLPEAPTVTTKAGKKAVKDIQEGYVTFMAFVEQQLQKL